MSNDDTFIEQPAPRQEPPPAMPPSMPPSMPPPPSGPPSRKPPTGLLAVVIGGIIVVLCLVAGFGIWRLYQNGTFTFGGSDDETDPVSLTLTALAEETPLPDIPTETPAPLPTDTIEPTSPPAPTDTQPPTELPTDTTAPTPDVPIFTAVQAGFCRIGPSSIYKEVRTMNAGDMQPILGRSISPVDGLSTWWLVEINSAQCYISDDIGTVSGDTSGVRLFEPPPTPSPTPTSTPTATPTATP